MELQILMEKERADKERKEREALEKEAVEKWKAKEAEKAAKEKKEKEDAEKELRRRMRERLLASGVPENQIEAYLNGKSPMPQGHGHGQGHGQGGTSTEITTTKTTYTRMARRHLSIEALRARAIDFELDTVSFLIKYLKSNKTNQRKQKIQNPEFVIIKRWVPPEEQKELWSLTRVIRDDREKVTTTLSIEDRSRHHRHKSGDNLVLVRKTKRERSKSPGISVLTYLAGGR